MHGIAPTFQDLVELAPSFNAKSNVKAYVEQLVALGKLLWDPNIPRSIRLPHMPKIFQVPILGRIAAGVPIEIHPSGFPSHDPETALDVAASLLSERVDPKSLFALEVRCVLGSRFKGEWTFLIESPIKFSR